MCRASCLKPGLRISKTQTQTQRWLDAKYQMFVLKQVSVEGGHWTRQDQVWSLLWLPFGVWDIWSFVAKDYEEGASSVQRRIGTLMDQLNMLSERWGTTELKVILLQRQRVDVSDPSCLPSNR